MKTFRKFEKFHTLTGQEATMRFIKLFVFVITLGLANTATADAPGPGRALPSEVKLPGNFAGLPVCKNLELPDCDYVFQHCVVRMKDGSKGEFLQSFEKPKNGRNGKDGKDGKDGAKGEKGDRGSDGKDGASAKFEVIEEDGWYGVKVTPENQRPIKVFGLSEGEAPSQDRLRTLMRAAGFEQQIGDVERVLKGMIGNLKLEVQENTKRIDQHDKDIKRIEEKVDHIHGDVKSLEDRYKLEEEEKNHPRKSGQKKGHDHSKDDLDKWKDHNHGTESEDGEKKDEDDGFSLSSLGLQLRIGDVHGAGVFYDIPFEDDWFFRPLVGFGLVSEKDRTAGASGRQLQVQLAVGKRFGATKKWTWTAYVQTTGTPWEPLVVDFPGISLERDVTSWFSLGATASLAALKVHEYEQWPKVDWMAGALMRFRVPE